MGKRYIIEIMCKGDYKHDINLMNRITNDEIDFQILLCRFINDLTRGQQKNFGQVLAMINQLFIKQKIEPICELASCYSDIRRKYVDGDYSMANHLPIPNVTMINDHSYVNINDCIGDFLLKQNDLDYDIDDWDNILLNNNDVNDMHMFKSLRIKEIINDAKQRKKDNSKLIVLFLTFWSDDFDPNKSIKSNRQSIWIKTLTIIAMNKYGTKIKSTYPLTLALKGSNHEVVEEKHNKMLELLKEGELIEMFSMSHQSLISVHADLYCILNDQPERRGNLLLSNGNSIIHCRFGWLLDCRQVKDTIRSCANCSMNIIQEATTISNIDMRYEWRTKNCNDCSCWLYDMMHKKLLYKPEKSFPFDLFNEEHEDGYLKPNTIKKKDIEKKINKLIVLLQNNKINKFEAKTYLKYTGINNKEQIKIMNNYNIMHEYKLSSAWYNCDDLKLYVDVPMHLLMLGIVKTVMLKINKILRMTNQNSNFVVKTNGILSHIKKMNIEWCKVLEYPVTEKTGGWVSENFLGLSRIGTWFYSLINFIDINPKHDVNINDINNLVNSTFNMIRIIMSLQTCYNDIIKIEAVIRVFLIYFDKIDKFTNETAVPSWIQQYNMLCLLNIPDILRQHGNIRNLWEGGNDGESYLKTVKSNLKAGMVKEWQTWVVNNLLKEKIYNEWKNSNKQYTSNIRQECRIYGTKKLAMESYKSGKPFSGIKLFQDIYLCYRSNGQIMGKKIKLDQNPINIYNMAYHNLTIANKSIQINEYNENYKGILFLPKLTKDGYPTTNKDCKYCYVCSDWS